MVNGHSRSQECQRARPCSDSDQEPSQDSDASENESSSSVSCRRRTRKTAMAAVSKIKLMETLEEDDGSDEEGRRCSVRHVTRASKRLAVIQSSGDSEEDDASQKESNKSDASASDEEKSEACSDSDFSFDNKESRKAGRRSCRRTAERKETSINGHGNKHQYNESEDNSDNERNASESLAEESDEGLIIKRKSTRMTAKAAVSKIKNMNLSDADEQDDHQIHQSRKQDVRSSDEDEMPRAQKHPHQNGRKVEMKSLKRSKLPSKSQEQHSVSKLQDIHKKTSAMEALTSTTQDSEELSDVPEKSVACRKPIKSCEDDDMNRCEDRKRKGSLKNKKFTSSALRKEDASSDGSSSETSVVHRKRIKSEEDEDQNQSNNSKEGSLRNRKSYTRRKKQDASSDVVSSDVSSSEKSVAQKKRFKSDEYESQDDDGGEKMSSAPKKQQSDASSDVCSSESEEKVVNKRPRKKESSSSNEWQQSEESEEDKKTHPRTRTCSKAASKRVSLRVVPKKNYVMEDSDEDFNSEVEMQCGRNKERVNYRARKPQGDSKRKRAFTTDSDQTSDENEPESKSVKPKRLKKGPNASGSSSETMCTTENGRLRGKQEQRSEEDSPKTTRQRQVRHNAKQRESDSYRSHDDESSSESDGQSESDSSSDSQSGPKTRLRGRERGSARLRKSQRDVSDEESDVSYGKPQRATRIRTRNRGKRTVNYQDSE